MRSVHNTDHVGSVIRAAERRRTLVFALEEAGLAMAMVLAGGILLLLLGSQILSWYWLALLAAVGVGLAATRLRRRPKFERYGLAQMLDRRLGLCDSLSTAWYLMHESRRDDPFARFQLARANEVAQSLRPQRAFRFSFRRWATTAALAAVAFGLFGVRYLITSSLSLEQALVPIRLAGILEAVERPRSREGEKSSLSLSAAARGESTRSDQPQNQDKNGALLAQEAKMGDSAGAGPGSRNAQNGSSRQEATESAENNRGNGQLSSSESQSQPNSTGQEREYPDANDHATADRQDSAGVLDKMKDALSSLMAKMRANAGSEQRGAQDGQRSEANQKAGNQTALGQDQRGNQPNAPSNQTGQQQSTEGQAQGQTTERSAGKSQNSEGGDRKNSDRQSGAGRQDGDKAIKEAEQQQAMGKLAEIIGKRSASLTGDMTVETRGGNQQLKTEYSQRVGQHSDLGGEINRNEIPLMYQQYIREYMEAVRKQRAQ